MQMSEREYLSGVSKMSPEELASAVANAGAGEARVLRIYLGDAQFEEIGRLSTQTFARRSLTRGPAPGNVVVLHGFLGGELTLLNDDGQSRIWVQALRLIEGQFGWLGLDSEGRSARDVVASGMYMRFYGTQLVRLSLDWNVRPFFYDWREDIRFAADALLQRINTAFGPEAPVHMVAHSMGGMVARAYIAKYPERWSKGGRLIMLGTPNYGSFAIPRLLFGTNDTLALIEKIDFHHSISDLLNVAKTFVSAYQQMPVEQKLPGLSALYRASTYNVVPIDQGLLDKAKTFQDEIADAIDGNRMVYIAGYNRLTMAGVADETQLNSDKGYLYSRRGDGTVPHDLGQLPGVTTFYVDEEHSQLPGNKRVQDAMNELLNTGTLQNEDLLSSSMVEEFANPRGIVEEGQREMLAAEAARRSVKEQQALALRDLLVGRGDTLGDTVSVEEQALNDLITRHDPPPMAGDVPGSSSTVIGTQLRKQSPRTKIRVRVVESNIQDLPRWIAPEEAPVDCIAVGHYLRVRPTGAERDLDRAITAAYPLSHTGAPLPEELILTQFHDRGLLRGELGVPFYLPDPRQGYEGTLLGIVGLGPTGQFGVPELTLVSRELCWSLGRMGKKHLATVLIGSGAKNLSTADAVHGWLVGANRALAGSANEGDGGIETLTFVLRPSGGTGAGRIADAVTALRREADNMRAEDTYRFDIELKDVPAIAEKPAADLREEQAATRISIDFENGQCRYSAMTGDASIAERVFEIQTRRVDEISSRLLSASDREEKLRLGKFLLNYLFPRDLRDQLTGSAPIVLACNNEAAKVYWELAAQPMEDEESGPMADQPYLGLIRGLTRQLRTVLAPPPEPPPPAGRTLRVLVVANGCREHPLSGAQQEAQLLLDLFDRINNQGGPDQIAATALVGPARATALDVLLQIEDHPPFDALHYAGHCVYDRKQPESSGFLFSGGDRLSARDLSRVDRTPKFVFANACESGVLPSRSDLSSPELPAAFAEAFFQRGVANFICTAWPVGDIPSRDFAVELYGALLGDNPERRVAPLYMALRQARRKIAGSQTWAAYQHYGNPYFRMFRSREKA